MSKTFVRIEIIKHGSVEDRLEISLKDLAHIKSCIWLAAIHRPDREAIDRAKKLLKKLLCESLS